MYSTSPDETVGVFFGNRAGILEPSERSCVFSEMAEKPPSALRRSKRRKGGPAVPESPVESTPGTPTVTITQAMTDGKLKLMQSSPLARLLPPSEQAKTPAKSSVRKATGNTPKVAVVNTKDASMKPAAVVDVKPEEDLRTFEEIRNGASNSGQQPSKAKKESTALEDGDELSSVLYLGHIPHGFYEREMRAYFSQFGAVNRLRLSRAPKTGASRGFAFIEFEDTAVATAAADAMSGYLMHGRALKTEVLPKSRVHPETFRGAERPFTKIDWMEKARLNTSRRSKDHKKLAKRLKKIEKKHRMKQVQLNKLGIEFTVPEIVKPNSS